jgi:hypothetical protein
MIDSRKKTNPCTKATKIPSAMIGRGAKKAPASAKQNGQDDLVSHHVSEQTESEGTGSGQVSDDFDDKDQWRHPPDRPHKVFDVADTMVFDTDDMGEHHHDEAQEGGVEVGGGRKNPGMMPIRLPIKM